MQESQNENSQPADVRDGSEKFRTIPQTSETFGSVPKASAQFGNVPHRSERKENHTLTVREAARMFESGGVARTERSITNWCQPSRTGMARLDAYFDPNERKYFITPQSVELAIEEEKAKAAKNNLSAETAGQGSETFRTVPQSVETEKNTAPISETDGGRIAKLEKKVMDLEILNAGKDFFIEQLKSERKDFFEEALAANHKLGELENRLLQLKQ